MVKNLKVKVLKKSKEALYPEHIIVERMSTRELVHLYFDDGRWMRMVHIKKDPQIRMAWDEKEKRYKELLPRYVIIQDTVRNDKDGFTYLKGPTNQNFFAFSVAPPWNSSSIDFKSYPQALSDFFIEMDLNDRCIPNAYIRNHDVADVKEIYPHQERRTCPNLKNFKKLVHD